MDYQSFLESKKIKANRLGFDPTYSPDILYPFQKAILKWSCNLGKAAIFADCGLGKTFMQLAWAENMRGKGRGCIVAPLGVTEQTCEEAARIGLSVKYARESSDIETDIFITNYERIAKFADVELNAIVLDESSILKSIDGKTKELLVKEFRDVPYKLCCTATPAPNDRMELGNHSEFLNALTMKEMLATFFINRQGDIGRANWVLKNHGRDSFYKWLASWALYMRDPKDIGFKDDRFKLPPLEINDLIVSTNYKPGGLLFPVLESGIRGRLDARKNTIAERITASCEKIESNNEPWIVWCGLNKEGQDIKKELGDQAVLVEGADSQEKKLESWHRWRDGDARIMISKPKIFGFGMNFQFCNNVLFLGMGDSYEQYYQAIRRCWRFGQKKKVNVQIVITNLEQSIADNVKQKERMAINTAKQLIRNVADYEKMEIGTLEKRGNGYKMETKKGVNWELTMGDSMEWINTVKENSIDMSVFSPPFRELFVYTASERDLGNSKNKEQFFEHFGFLVGGLLRATKQGRVCCVHVAQVPTIKYVDGFIGMKDFRGEVVSEFVDRGWIYHGEVVIDKDPQVQAIRTKAKGLLFASLKRDASWLRPGLADYILLFKKPGENKIPVRPKDVSNNDWIRWARPVWYGINETNVLKYRDAKSDDDTKHICPLQLETIERCIRLWSNPGDLVCSPFAGVGSEGHVALKFDRRFIGCELKEEYWKVACRNLRNATNQIEMEFADGHIEVQK